MFADPFQSVTLYVFVFAFWGSMALSAFALMEWTRKDAPWFRSLNLQPNAAAVINYEYVLRNWRCVGKAIFRTHVANVVALMGFLAVWPRVVVVGVVPFEPTRIATAILSRSLLYMLTHTLLHTKWIDHPLKRFHAVHHQHVTCLPHTALYYHPVDFFVLHTGPLLFLSYVLRLGHWTLACWLVFEGVFQVAIHSSCRIQFFPMGHPAKRVERAMSRWILCHDLHHRNPSLHTDLGVFAAIVGKSFVPQEQ